MNATEHCWQRLTNETHADRTFLAKSVFLSSVVFLVVGGNLLVVVSVFLHRTLHTTTNYLITSLAFSDLFLGIFVLPFSVSQALFAEIWPYGGIWCELWKAIDVWLCTASIYNLVAISFDRYMAVTRPISYRFISSRRTGKYLVLTAWAVSFIISAPPLVINFILNESHDEGSVHQQCECTPMNNSDGYIIYSASGSFIIPLAAILFLNHGIFINARIAGQVKLEQTALKIRQRAMKNQRKLPVKMPQPQDEQPPQTLTLRVHRGGFNANQSDGVTRKASQPMKAFQPTESNRSKMTASSEPRNSLSVNSHASSALQQPKFGIKIEECDCELVNGENDNHLCDSLPVSATQVQCSRISLPDAGAENCLTSEQRRRQCSQPNIQRTPMGESGEAHVHRMHMQRRTTTEIANGIAKNSPPKSPTPEENEVADRPAPFKRQITFDLGAEYDTQQPVQISRARRMSRMFVQRVRSKVDKSGLSSSARDAASHEARVARTILIVVGCFVVCWVPFTVLYVLGIHNLCTIENGCVPAAVFEICFWLGYCNSALNPIIYALFSRDLRRAFKKTLKRAHLWFWFAFTMLMKGENTTKIPFSSSDNDTSLFSRNQNDSPTDSRQSHQRIRSNRLPNQQALINKRPPTSSNKASG